MIHLYTEAQSIAQTLRNDYTYSTTFSDSITLSELVYFAEAEHRYKYEYSVYYSKLFQAVADDLEIYIEWQEVHLEFSRDKLDAIYINEAIFRLVMNKYGDNKINELLRD